MAVQFILGRSGTGKTSCCIRSIVNGLLDKKDNRPLILLVPEQATYQAERAILSDRRIKGYSTGTELYSDIKNKSVASAGRLNVLSFSRLQFLLLAKNIARPELSRIGQQMIVHRLLRQYKDKLKVLGTSANQPGTASRIAQTILELHRHAKTPEDIDQLTEQLKKDKQNTLIAQKFSDIGFIFKEYIKFIEGKFINPDIQLNLLREEVGKADFVQGARLWVDGFAGFTPIETAILAELLKTAEDCQIALCLDPTQIDLKNFTADKIDPSALFSSIQWTYAELVEIIKKCKLKLAEPVILDEAVRFSGSQQLCHIERNIFKFEPAKIKSANNIRLISTSNARTEVQLVARQILKLIKEKNLRFRDIAVIASDIGRYQHYIKAYFDEYNIPFFIDKRKSLYQHPVITFICSALQVISSRFSSEDILAYLKTPLVPIEDRDVDLLENYCLAFGVDRDDWQSDKDWQFQDIDNQHFDEKHINLIRQKATRPLFELSAKLYSNNNQEKPIGPDEFTRIISDFLNELKVNETISNWIEEAEEKKDNAAIDEHQQFYQKLMDIFDELCEAFAGQKMNYSDYFAIMDSAFSQMTLALIPSNLEEVLIGSIERSRHPDLKAVFLIGATQKYFPAPIEYSGILTDTDRTAAQSSDFQLSATVDQALAERQYLAYIAFTRPSQFLYITYPLADDKGSATARSQFITNLESLFEDFVEESVATEQIQPQDIYSETELADLLCSRLGADVAEDNKPLIQLLNDIRTDKQFTQLGASVFSAINYDNNAQLGSEIVEKLFAQPIRASATRLGTFAACPYKYFARYILNLEQRKEFKFEPLDIGVFYHHVLDSLLKQLNYLKKDFSTVEDKELLELLREQIIQLIQGDSFISKFVSHRAHNAFIINLAGEILESCVLAIAQMVRAGNFKPTMSEAAFGQESDSLGQYKIEISSNSTLTLNGKIDRIDIANLAGENTAIVFDYKRKEKSFSWSKIYYGLDMQLSIYLLAVRNADKSRCEIQQVAGAFYLPVETSIKSSTIEELPDKTDDIGYKARGIFNGQYFQELDSKTASGRSKFYNFHILKDGSQYGNYTRSDALNPADFEKVLQFTNKKIIELAKQILSGQIEVKPYRLANERACNFCKYKSVCRFDWQINEYKILESRGKKEILEEIIAS